MRRPWIIALLLAALTLALYWPVRHFDLVYFDDPLLLNDSPEIRAGLTWNSLKWAFSSVVIANWQPVTNVSFLLVSQFFGVAPGPHHLANALAHAANAALVLLVFWQLTGARWRSLIIAAIFAWHPLRVESVAWIAERKDVLCAFFFLLSLLFYARFAQAAQRGSRDRWDYGASLTAFALALLSKPMAVTLPCVLLLLDVWPLERFGGKPSFFRSRSLLSEKIPFFALMFFFCAATYWIQHDYAAMTPWARLGLAPRVANAIAGYVAYPMQLFWPVNLAAIYPYPASIDWLDTGLKAGLLLAVSAGCGWQLRCRPWLAVGWCWYLITALPVIGIVQVGEQSMADRYTYLPLIGPVAALVWTAAEWSMRGKSGRIWGTAMAVIVLIALAALTERQLQFWRNTVALFTHNLAVTPNNSSAESTLAMGFEHAGDTNRAIASYRAARAMEPRDYQNRRDLAGLLARHGELGAAEAEYQSLLVDEPANYLNPLGLASVYAAQGRPDESLAQLNEVLRLNPDCVEALNNLAWALATSPRADLRDGARAVALAQRACELTRFRQAIFIGTLAAAQAEAGRFDEAAITGDRASAVAEKSGEPDLMRRNHELADQYRAHRPARDPGPN